MQLVVQSGAEPGRTFDLNVGSKLSIGRQSSNQIVVGDEQVSRRHAEVEISGGVVRVTDLSSSNGTFVNGTRISSAITLKPGDTLQVGTTVLKLMDAQAGLRTIPGGSYDAPATIPVADYAAQSAAEVGEMPPAYGSGSSNGVDVGYGQPATPSFGGNNYGQATPEPYAQPAAYNQGQPQASAYGQSPASPAYGQQPSAYGQSGQNQNYAYGQPNNFAPQPVFTPSQAGPSAVPTKKRSPLLLIGVIAGLLVLVIAGVLAVLLTSNATDLPTPPNATKIEVSTAEQTELAKQVKDTRYTYYFSTDSQESLTAFYKDKLAAKGYSLDSRSSPTQLVFTSPNRAALVLTAKLDKSTIDSLESSAASFKGKLKEGGTLIGLAEGKKSDLTTT